MTNVKSGECRAAQNLCVKIIGAKVIPFADLLAHVNLTVTEDNRLEIAYVVESDVAKLLQLAARRRNKEKSGETFHQMTGLQRYRSMELVLNPQK